MFKRTFTVLLGSLAAGALLAQEAEEDYTVVLPEAAQKCVLPTAPDAVPPDADYDALVAAKGQVGEFQNAVLTYRECLSAAEEAGNLTAGNKQALVESYNYSVDMEERVAQRFNDAVKAYKERQASTAEQ